MPRVTFYARVSTNDIDQINSLRNQIEHYTELFKDDKYQTIKEGMFYSKQGGEQYLEGGFCDEGITGTKVKNRKAFAYMLECAKKGCFDVLYVKNVPRFSRNITDGTDALKLLKGCGVRVIFEDGNLNYHDHELMVNMFLSVSQEESRGKSVAIQYGIRRAQKQRKWTSAEPYGYTRDNGFLKKHPTESKVIQLIFDLYTNKGYGHNKIIRELESKNISTKKGGKWYQQHIKVITTNPLYTGNVSVHRTENNDVNIHLIEDIPKHEWITYHEEDLRIISDEQFNLAKDLAEKRSKEFTNKHRHSDANLFSTILTCGNCNSVMRRKKKKTKVNQLSTFTGEYEWVCSQNDYRGASACEYRNRIDEAVLIEFVKEKINDYRNQKKFFEQRLAEYLELYYNSNTDEKLADIQSQISELQLNFENKIRLNTKKIITDEELEKFTVGYRKDLNILQSEEQRIKNLNNEIEKVKRKYNDFITYVQSVDINNLTNFDLKKLFSFISVFTADHLYWNEDGVLSEYNKFRSTLKYHYFNEIKGQIKEIKAELMFMDMEERKVDSDYFFNIQIDKDHDATYKTI